MKSILEILAIGATVAALATAAQAASTTETTPNPKVNTATATSVSPKDECAPLATASTAAGPTKGAAESKAPCNAPAGPGATTTPVPSY